jgi:DNA polymerase-3 subunit alpha
MGYVSLHNHSVYSLLDGLIHPEELAKSASDMGAKAIAITDHGNMSGCIKFYKSCKENNIKPILGIEAYYCDDATKKEKGEKRYHIIILAKSSAGFYNLMKLMTNAHKNFYYVPRIDLDMLINTKDIIVSTACMSGLLSHPNYEKICILMKNSFGDDFYLEYMPLDMEEQIEVNKCVEEMRIKHNIKTIITNDVHYLEKDDHSTHQLLLKINTKNPNFSSPYGLYLKTDEGIIESANRRMSYIPKDVVIQSIKNTSEIADKVNIELFEKKIVIPISSSVDPAIQLRRIVKQRYNSMYKNRTRESDERLEYELNTIIEKDFSSYFLMVFRFIQHARNNNVELGAGRGSSAGSLVCFILGITELDPIQEGLLFERFLNPERTDYPDIDIDIPKSKRGIMLEYLISEYGENNVSNITTFSKLKPKSAFKDVAREYGVNFFESNMITKLFDDDKSILDMYEENDELKKQLFSIPKHEDIIKHSDKLCGTLRQTGTHAAGIVISETNIDNFGIIEKRKNEYSLNWDMDDVSFFGLVKFDVLGLIALDIIADTKALIGKPITWDNIYDKEVLDEFGKGNVVGIFQFHSSLMSRLLKDLERIDNKQVLVDANALGRPGPLESGMTKEYVSAHKEDVMAKERGYSKHIKEIVKDTRGVIIYQEQIIQILVQTAGYTVPQADIVRKAIAKSKGQEAIREHLEEFVSGCDRVSNIDLEVSRELFSDLEKFGRYGFNKSHAAAYTELALRQMWLKINYPIEYMSSLYKNFEKKEEKASVTREMKRLGVELLDPDINLSNKDFSVEENGIRIGLLAIKNVGEKAVNEIIKQRGKNPYDSIEDFRVRNTKRTVNKRVFESLIKCGSFDMLGVNQKLAIEAEEYFKNVLDHTEFKQDLYEEEGDYTEIEKKTNKMLLMPGVYSVDVDPEPEMQIDTNRLESFQEIIKSCSMCPLFKFYRKPTPFEFNSESKAMVIAEAPGFHECNDGKPLIGRAGQHLIKELEDVGIYRRHLYLTNVFKCRPLENKLPDNPDKTCWEYLKKEIEITKPKMIMVLGNRSQEFFTGNKSGIMAKAASLQFYTELIGNELVPVIYNIHPSAVVRDNGYEKIMLFRSVINKFSEAFWGLT